MMKIKMKAYAKINLTLEVEEKLPNGYHRLNTVMQSVSLYDYIRIERSIKPGIALKCNLPYVPCDGRNIVHKAAVAFYEKLGKTDFALEIDMDKRIPVGAGLAGGSADCGAVLEGLNRLESTPFSKKELYDLGSTLGADVPFTMMGGCAVAYGVGYELERCKGLPSCYVVLCKPRFSISTKVAFESLTTDSFSKNNYSGKMLDLLEKGELTQIAGGLYNTFEDAVGVTRPALAKIKKKLLDCGAIGAVMSGSGSTMVGIFNNSRRAYAAQNALKRLCQDVFITRPTPGR